MDFVVDTNCFYDSLKNPQFNDNARVDAHGNVLVRNEEGILSNKGPLRLGIESSYFHLPSPFFPGDMRITRVGNSYGGGFRLNVDERVDVEKLWSKSISPGLKRLYHEHFLLCKYGGYLVEGTRPQVYIELRNSSINIGIGHAGVPIKFLDSALEFNDTLCRVAVVAGDLVNIVLNPSPKVSLTIGPY